MQVREYEYDSTIYREALHLRNRMLRQPLGLSVFDEPLEGEQAHWHYGLFADDQLFGCLIAVPKTDQHVKLRQMAIDDSKQGNGYGRLLITSVEQLLLERGIKTIELAARAVVAEFYLKLGYQQHGDEFVEVGIPHLEMRKQLA